jgi:hypothetical protein
VNGFITEKKCVFCAVRTECLNTTHVSQYCAFWYSLYAYVSSQCSLCSLELVTREAPCIVLDSVSSLMLIARHRPVITWTDRSRCLLRHRRNRSGRSALTITLLLRDLLLQNKLRDREHMDCIGLTNCTEYIANCG